MHWFRFNDHDSRDYGLYIVSKQIFNRNARNMNFISVPGHDGDIIIDNKSYKNDDCQFVLRLFAKEIYDKNLDFVNALDKVVDWLVQDANYHVFESSYDPGYFRYGCIKSDAVVEQIDHDIANITFTISFKPYRYLWEGNVIHTTTEGVMNLYNPGSVASKPLIKVYPLTTGSFYIKPQDEDYMYFSVSASGIPFYIDSEEMNVYAGSVNMNDKYNSTSFPVLKPGKNTIGITTAITKIEVMPRWRSR